MERVQHRLVALQGEKQVLAEKLRKATEEQAAGKRPQGHGDGKASPRGL